MEFIKTDKAPSAIGPYSQAVKHGDLIFLSGQIPLDTDGNMVEGEIEDQVRQVIENMKAVLEEAGSGIEKVLKTTIFLNDLSDFSRVNEVYGSYFTHKPARSTIQARLPKDAKVEIEAIASL